MAPTPEHRCEIEALPHHRIIDRDKALELGMSTKSISRRLASRRWRIVYPNTYFVGPGTIPWKSRLVAACRWAGPGSVVSHMAAAQLHGLLRSVDRVSVTSARRLNSRHGIEVHWAPKGTGRNVTVDSIPSTSVERTLLDISRRAGRPFAIELVERSIRDGRTNLRRLAALLDEPSSPSCPDFKWILEKRFALGVTDSEAEDLYLRLARRDPTCAEAVHHFVVTRHGQHLAELDFAYPLGMVDVEIDGDESHSDPVAKQRDKRRDALLAEMGWVVLRFTYWQLVDEPDWVIDRVRATVLRRRFRQGRLSLHI
jgi:very-short-patch-repair endonuclease